MANKDVNDWEYQDTFYNEESERKVRSFEEIAAECEELMSDAQATDDTISNDRLKEVAKNVGDIKALSSKGMPVAGIALELGLDETFVKDVLITISGSPEDNSDMAIAYLLTF